MTEEQRTILVLEYKLSNALDSFDQLQKNFEMYRKNQQLHCEKCEKTHKKLIAEAKSANQTTVHHTSDCDWCSYKHRDLDCNGKIFGPA